MKVLLILFGIFLALPMTFRATRDLLGPWVADAAGDPTGAGFVFHALVLAVLVIGTSKTISMFRPADAADARCAAPGPSPDTCATQWTFDQEQVGKKCHVKGDPKSAYLGWVQPDRVTCDFTAPPAGIANH